VMAFDEAVTVYGDPLSVLLPDPGTTVSRRYEHHRFGPLSWTSFPIPRRSTRRCEPSRRFSGGASGLKDGSEAPNKRSKLPAALVLKEAVVSCPDGHGPSSTTLAPAGESPAA